jgi:predicted flap endonuclease-1-like 5' DNA nuclease
MPRASSFGPDRLQRFRRRLRRRARERSRAASAARAGERGGVPLWIWGILSAAVLWLLYVRRRDEADSAPAAVPERTARLSIEVTEPAADAATPQAADDLTRIDGIGPVIARRLNAAGVRTYADLAGASTDRLRDVVSNVGLGLADPASWPEQARLAAAGDWGRLTALQDQLRAERR